MGLRTILSIEIGYMHTRICEVSYRKKKSPIIYRSFSVETPKDSMRDGYIQNPEALGAYLLQHIQDAGFENKNVIFTMDSSRVMSREVEIPYVKQDMISKLVHAQIHEYMPIDTSDCIISQTLIHSNKKAKEMRLMVFAVPEDLIRRYYSLAEKMELEIESIDYSGNAMYQWLKPIIKDEAAVVVQIGEVSSKAIILDGGALMLQRTIGTGTELLLNRSTLSGISAFEEFPEGKPQIFGEAEEEGEYISPYAEERAKKEAEQAALALEKIKEEKTEGQPSGQEENADDISLSEMEMLIESIGRIVDYHSAAKKGNPVNKIYIIGEGASIRGIDELISGGLDLPVECLLTLPGAIFKGDAKEMSLTTHGGWYIGCAGASIAPLDLIPYELSDYEQKKFDRKTYLVLLGGVAIACLLIIISSQLQYFGLQREQTRLKADIASKQYIVELQNKYNAAKKECDYLLELHKGTYRDNEKLNYLFYQMEEKLPSNAMIISMIANDEIITISFEATSKRVATKTLLQLKNVDYLENVKTVGISDDGEKITFVVTCEYSDYKPKLAATGEIQGVETATGEGVTADVNN